MISTISADAMRYAKRTQPCCTIEPNVINDISPVKSPITTFPRFHRIAKCGSIKFEEKEEGEKRERSFSFGRMERS